MAFVNEEIPELDVEKYHIDEISKGYFISKNHYWTIDRKRDIYLRWMRYDREEPSENDFTFYWNGRLFHVRLQITAYDGIRGGKGSTTWALQRLWRSDGIEISKEEVIPDLKEALIAFKDFGVFSTIADHTAHFEF